MQLLEQSRISSIPEHVLLTAMYKLLPECKNCQRACNAICFEQRCSKEMIFCNQCDSKHYLHQQKDILLLFHSL